MNREHGLKVIHYSHREYGGECLADLCGWRPLRKETRHEIEDEFRKHIAEVQRARAALGRRNPSLKSERDWYRDQANNHTLPVREREMWKQLADELDHRLNDTEHTSTEQMTLPFG